VTRRSSSVEAAGLAIGIGMGGFVDGIVFHQIFQLHNMLSARITPTDIIAVKVNMVWDGIFHAAVWCATAIGISLLWRAVKAGAPLSNKALAGSMWLGWGLFNVVEGVVDHHLLELHHVYEALGRSIFDYAFLAWGAVMIAVGWAMRAAAARALDAQPGTV
jgi:uncharacterized membrane protein